MFDAWFYCIGSEEDFTVSVFVWSAEVQGQLKYFVALFDINQWYQAQMPNALRVKRSGKYTG